jgi:hypothetical protein
MIVSFDPAISGGVYAAANTEAYYINFLRCVTAIATANAGTTSLNVNPYLTTSTVDGTKNCILSIIANSEAGGWNTSNTTHSIPTYPATFTAMASLPSFAQMYKADFWNNSGKASMPFNKMTFHAIGHNSTGNDNNWNGRITPAPLTNWTANGGQIMMTFGCNDSQNSSGNYTPTWSTTTPNQQTTSFTNNGYHSTVVPTLTSDTTTAIHAGPVSGFNLGSAANVTYTMAVTKDYCIIWENVRTHSYISGYSTGYTARYSTSNYKLFGSLMYGGFRTTQPWEDAISHNPPWVAWTVHHCNPTNSTGYPGQIVPQGGRIWPDQFGMPSPMADQIGVVPGPGLAGSLTTFTTNATNVQPPNTVAAYMTTITDLGEPSTTSSRYVNNPMYCYHRNQPYVNMDALSGTGLMNAGGKADSWLPANPAYGNTEWDISTPIFWHRQKRSSNWATANHPLTHNPNLPTIDPTTGTFVPGAYPVNISRTKTGSWNNGGICKGIYKSLTLPINTMKLYFSDNQTFTVNSEQYIPIVFNEDMYLIRKA